MRCSQVISALILLAGCSSVQPPPSVELSERQLTPITDLAANSKGKFTDFSNSVATESPRTVGLSAAAQNFRERQRLAAIAILADTPEARAVALQQVREADEKAKENEKKLEDLIGGGFGLGLTMTINSGDDRVESATVVGDDKLVRITKDKNLVPRLLLETHYLFTTNPFRPTAKTSLKTPYSVEAAQRENCKNDVGSCPKVGFGPFVGIQQTADGASFDALAIGATIGFRPGNKAGITVGLGAMFDSSVKVLGEGISAGKPLPKGETEVRLKETSQISPVLSVSLSF